MYKILLAIAIAGFDSEFSLSSEIGPCRQTENITTNPFPRNDGHHMSDLVVGSFSKPKGPIERGRDGWRIIPDHFTLRRDEMQTIEMPEIPPGIFQHLTEGGKSTRGIRLDTSDTRAIVSQSEFENIISHTDQWSPEKTNSVELYLAQIVRKKVSEILRHSQFKFSAQILVNMIKSSYWHVDTRRTKTQRYIVLHALSDPAFATEILHKGDLQVVSDNSPRDKNMVSFREDSNSGFGQKVQLQANSSDIFKLRPDRALLIIPRIVEPGSRYTTADISSYGTIHKGSNDTSGARRLLYRYEIEIQYDNLIIR